MPTSVGLFLLAVSSLALSSPVQDTQYAKEKTKCYGELGCFSTGGPFYHPTIRPINVLPDEREVVNVKYYLFTRNNPNTRDNLSWRSSIEDLKKSHFKGDRQSKFITHGFIDTQFLGKWMVRMKDEFLKEGDYNVIIVDWQEGNSLPYTQATANTRLVGAEIALLITKLQKAFGIDPMSCHVLGHSLGGQIVGYAGERLKTLGRITAFDPAEPYFQGMPKEVRTDPTDADFVEVIHTDAAPFLPNIGLGAYEACGHVDFYPNGGLKQPGCTIGDRLISIVIDGLVEGVRKVVVCQHQRAVDLYHESINSKCLQVGYACPTYEGFLEGKCASCGNDGKNCAPLGHRSIDYRPHKSDDRLAKFFLVTAGKTPYCLYHHSFSLKMARRSGAKAVTGHFYATLHGEKGSVEIKLNDGKRQLHPGATYTFLGTNGKDVGKVKDVTFRYDSSSILSKPDLHLDFLEIFPMNQLTDSTTRSKYLTRFCHPDGIKSKKAVLLQKC